ncbi:YfbM family protein [Luteolibacter luteus]|uniref:YfbM family protein n=1 Tax=Luteolibacter luteus TaxID=2728835 RepID=A0A858RF38_9BACT|nr:YfbM family protein [Luteolibacter luteus]QJE95352.1 YfbM family protein [Luteolibacter luteus]
MACLGVHFAITDEDLVALRQAGSDEALMEVIEGIEERWEEGENLVCETDKAWDAIHRCLTDGTLSFESGTEPLNLCILGGEQLYEGEDYIVALINHSQLRQLADALVAITPEFLGARYSQLPEDYSRPKSQEDCQYTWDWFSSLPAFFDGAAKSGRHVIFTVDQ